MIQEHIATLSRNAAKDSERSGIPLPSFEKADDIVNFMAVAGNVLFMAGDPNLDNQKRNIAIQVFLNFTIPEMVSFCQGWLCKWQQNSQTPWHQEWCAIAERASSIEFADIILSHDEERVRQRLSSPLGEMLDFDVVLQIKRKWYRHEEK